MDFDRLALMDSRCSPSERVARVQKLIKKNRKLETTVRNQRVFISHWVTEGREPLAPAASAVDADPTAE